MQRFLVHLVLASILLANTALAKNPPAPPRVAPVMNMGAFGLVAPGAWVGQYVYGGPGLIISPTTWFSFVPSVTFEVSPGVGNWGFSGNFVLEFAPSSSPVAIDIIPSIIQDTAPAGATVAIWAMGPGANILFPGGVSLCLGFQIAGIVGDAAAGITFNPLLNFSLPIPKKS